MTPRRCRTGCRARSRRWPPATTRRTFVADLIAGVTVGLVALPLAMAFAIASGLTPQAGIYCAIITGFLISALGGSRFQIGGPTGAFVVVVAGIVATYGIDGLFMCTLMAGVMLVIMGLTGTGTRGEVHPAPGDHRLHQRHRARDRQHAAAGLPRPDDRRAGRVHRPHPDDRRATSATVSRDSVALGDGTLVLLIVWSRYVKRVPAYIVALFAGTARGDRAAARRGDDRIAVRRHSVRACRTSRCRTFRPELILTLLSPALTVAMLGAIESLLSAVVADRMGGDRHNPNTELFAQGVANIVSPLFGGLPATGALARTATNIRSGARSPVAGHDPRADAARRAAVRRPLRRLRAAAGAGRDPVRRRLEHGRVARDRARS